MSDKKVNLELIASKFAKENVGALFDQIAYYQDKHGKEFVESLFTDYLASLIGAMIYKTLSDRNSGKSPEERYNRTSEAFIRMKELTQDAVSAGIQGSLLTFTGKTVEYLCRIEPIAEPPNKLSH